MQHNSIIRVQVKYKAERYDTQLVFADRFFPSSQLCSQCGNRQKIPLSQRVYNCVSCSLRRDRDFNASLNLENYEDIMADGSFALRFVDGVLPTVPCEANGKHQQ